MMKKSWCLFIVFVDTSWPYRSIVSWKMNAGKYGHVQLIILVIGGTDYFFPARRQGLYLVYTCFLTPIGWLHTTYHPLSSKLKIINWHVPSQRGKWRFSSGSLGASSQVTFVIFVYGPLGHAVQPRWTKWVNNVSIFWREGTQTSPSLRVKKKHALLTPHGEAAAAHARPAAYTSSSGPGMMLDCLNILRYAPMKLLSKLSILGPN